MVHETFPEPVPYIDKTGMLPSFPRKIFTMTTYGLRLYRAGGEAVERPIGEQEERRKYSDCENRLDDEERKLARYGAVLSP